jgi:hypothetical protein
MKTQLSNVMAQYDYWKEAHDQVMEEIAATSKTMKYTLEDTFPNNYFKYIIDIGKVLDFHAARKWMSETYGYTEDISKDKPGINQHWSFTIDYRIHKIYLKGDEELSWFKIKHGHPL